MSGLFNPLPTFGAPATTAGARSIVVVDTREQAPLVFTRLPSVGGALITGDYSFRGGEDLFAVERKTIADLVACCVGDNRDRFFRELHRLRGFRFKRLLIVGTVEEIEAGSYRSRVAPKAVLATLAAIEARFDVPVVFAPSPEAAALKIESWASWCARELVVMSDRLLRASANEGAAEGTACTTASS